MRECSKCGFPLKVARFFEWRNDGTIISTDRANTKAQITFLELGELEKLFEVLSAAIKTPVDPFMIQAQKNIGKAINANIPIRHIKRIPSNRFFRPQWFAKMMVRLIREDIALLGDGILSLDSYRAGHSLDLRLANPCLIPMLVGSSLGIYESVEKMPGVDFEYGLEDGDLVIHMRHGEKTPESESRLYLEKVEPSTGPLDHEKCPVCGIPVMVAYTFEWDIDKGIIINRLTGKRKVVVSVQSVNAIFRELENELGEEVPGVLYDTQKDLTKVLLLDENTEDLDGFWKRHLEYLALRGLGYPLHFERDERSVSVGVGNAYNQVLFAAKIAAALEISTGLPSEISWVTREGGHGSYTISV